MALAIAKHRIDDNLVITLEGRLDSTNSQELMDTISNSLQGVTDLVIDLEKLEYMSSAGIRQLVATHKQINSALTLKHVSPEIMDVLRVTGLDKKLNIEP